MGAEPSKLESKDRVFIMIGNTRAGKSTLGNLLLGQKSFKVLQGKVSFATTTLVTTAEVEIDAGTVLGMNLKKSNVLRIKVIDQPGIDDTNFDIQDHCKNLIKCMLEVDVKTFPTFLIVINLLIDNLSDDSSLLLNQLSESLTQSSYSLFSHAVVVFTHFDKLECDINDIDALKQIVMGKCQHKHWRELRDILDAVDNRCMFVDGTNPDALNRNRILRELFILSKSILSIRFHGNNYFTSDFLKRKLGVYEDQVVEEELYKFDYQFPQDLNLFWRDEMRDLNLDQQIEKALISMVALGEGVSSVVILVSLLKSLSTQMEALIYDLPSHYLDEDELQLDERKKDWWNHVFFVFEVPSEEGGRESVETNLTRNRRLKTLVEKGSKKWTWIAEDTPQWKCRDRIAKTCLVVRKQIGGKVFIQDTVIKELDKIRKDADRYKGENTQITQYGGAFHDKMAKGAINFIKSDNIIIMKFGGIFIRHKISIRSMRMILRNTMLSNDEMKRFKERYKDPKAKVTIGEILEFLANP